MRGAAVRFGIFSFGRAPYGDLGQRVRLAEGLGFASAWVDDDLLVPDYSDFEPWTLLGALARETSTIRLGTMVTAITFRHPSLLAAQVITLDHVSGGRAELGLGAGGHPHPYAAFSQHPWSPLERAERLEEQAAILGPLLRGETVTRDGPHYPVPAARAPAAMQRPRPPFTIAAHGDRGLRTVALHADGWNSLGGQPYSAEGAKVGRVSLEAAIAETKRRSDRLVEVCRDEGRDPVRLLVRLGRDNDADPPPLHVAPGRGTAVALVPGDAIRPYPRPPPSRPLHRPTLHEHRQHRLLVPLAGRQEHHHRLAAPLASEVDLRAVAAATASEPLRFRILPLAPAACWCARTTVLSTKCSVQSSRPSASARRCSAT